MTTKPIHRALSVIAFIGMCVGVMFNSCSDVSFSKSSSSESKNNIPPGCGSQTCGEETEYTDIITVPVIARKADVLLVIDNSVSMKPEIEKLGNRLTGFVDDLDFKGIDWQICHVLTEGSGQTLHWKTRNNNGSIVSTQKIVLSKDDPNRETIFNTTMGSMSANGSGDEQGLTAMSNAIKRSQNADCFRNDAILAVIVLSDEDQKSCGGLCQFHPGTQYRDADEYRKQYRALTDEDQPIYFVNLAQEKFGVKPVTVNSIVIKDDDPVCLDEQDRQYPAFYGTIYSNLSRTTGGLIGSICEASYAQQLTDIGKDIENSLASLSLKCPPTKVESVMVVGSTKQHSHTVAGNKITFTPALPAGSTVTIKYNCSQPI